MGKNYVLAIIKDEERLSTRFDEINVFENQAAVRKCVSDLKDTMKANKDLICLSAPQLGYNYRIFCIRFADENIQTFINPMTTKVEGRCLMIEHTLSRPDKEYMIQRPERLMAGYQKVNGQYNELSLKHPLAAVFQYMLDMIDGTLFFKHDMLGLPIDKDYYKASKEEKEELHNWYFETYLPERMSYLEKQAEEDEGIKNLQTQIKYYKSIIDGTTEVVPAYGEELDFENSSLKVKEAEDEGRKIYLDKIKKQYGVEDNG